MLAIHVRDYDSQINHRGIHITHIASASLRTHVRLSHLAGERRRRRPITIRRIEQMRMRTVLLLLLL